MAPHSSTLAWKIPWTEEPGRCQSLGSWRVKTQLSDFTFTFHFHALDKEMASQSSVLAWRIPGTAEPGGLLSVGSHRVRHDWNNLAAGIVCLSPALACSLRILLLHMLYETWKMKAGISREIGYYIVFPSQERAIFWFSLQENIEATLRALIGLRKRAWNRS